MTATASRDTYVLPEPDGVWLHSDSLFSKWGFNDGDILSDLDVCSALEENEVLCALVKRFLLPACPAVKTYELSTSHNPIRAEPDEPRFDNVAVFVPMAEVVAEVERVRHG